MSKKISREEVVVTWYMRALKQLFWAFMCDDLFSDHKVFHITMGFELVCKAYLLGCSASEYEVLPLQKGKEKIDSMARKIGHDFKKIFERLSECLGEDEVNKLLDENYSNCNGGQLLKVFSMAYFEARYPVPRPSYMDYHVENGNGPWDLMRSWVFGDFCYKTFRKISLSIKNDMGISIPKDAFDRAIYGEKGQRFINSIFEGNAEKYVAFKPAECAVGKESQA